MNHKLERALMNWAEQSLATRLYTLRRAISEDWDDECVLKLIKSDGHELAPGGREGTVLSTTPTGTICEVCNKAPATMTVQGDTDSFGAEYIECCAACNESLKEDKYEPYDDYPDGDPYKCSCTDQIDECGDDDD